ncbi:membrane protein insertion efficiency factor YidD [Spiractinospora alimapuensis]|uniref:membrane protein insertion efficiency factor YidD n=1 Tax=Spiractinospora alimapuensis TaxID=2820884 RepID=UPI001EEA1689|nr:membrane protein insertion efficiency factor YidD [Spiractinospora alimapuensis]QVQ50505.1 membrane protein insertion efficiency factor YidD [Spiractinospora alimapuensis]
MSEGTTPLAARVLIVPVRGYQRFISPVLPPTCRFYPSCSAYAVQALRAHGALRGLWLTVRRLARCHPFHKGGLDPVPPGRFAPPDETQDDSQGASGNPEPNPS